MGLFGSLPEKKQEEEIEVDKEVSFDNVITGVFDYSNYMNNLQPKTEATIERYVTEVNYEQYVEESRIGDFRQLIANIQFLNEAIWSKMYALIVLINRGKLGSSGRSVMSEVSEYRELKILVQKLDENYRLIKQIIPQNVINSLKRDYLYEVLYYPYQRIVQEAARVGIDK